MTDSAGEQKKKSNGNERMNIFPQNECTKKRHESKIIKKKKITNR